MSNVNYRNLKLSTHLFEGVVFDHVEWKALRRYRDESMQYLEYARYDFEKGVDEIDKTVKKAGYLYGVKF